MNQDHEPLEVIDTHVGSTEAPAGRRRWLRATAVVAMVGAGGLGSWALSQPSNSSAAESATETSSDAASTGTREHGPGRHGRGPGLDAAAEALGLSVDELRTKLEGGATLAEIAAEQGVEVDTLVAAIVADATTDIDAKVEAGEIDEARATEIKDGLLERVTAMVNGEFRGGHGPGGGGPGGFGHHRGAHLETAAEVLGLEPDALAEELRSGQTLAEIAAEQDVAVDTLIDALVDDARARITAMVNGEPPADAPGDAAA
jgi:hypothetical protein